MRTGWIDLAAYGCAHRATAIAFCPGDDYSSVTLSDALEPSAHCRAGEYELSNPGLLDLYTIGWAARTAAITFNR
jgi:hypothetical protein